MEEKCGFIQQSFFRFYTFYNYALRIILKLIVFFFCKLLASINNYRRKTMTFYFPQFMDKVEPAHVRQADIQYHTIDVILLIHSKGIFAGCCFKTFYITIPNEYTNCFS